jgi:hypothetical protein
MGTVSLFARPLSPLASVRRLASRIDAPSGFGLGAIAAAGLGIALLVTLVLAAAPAGAVVTEAGPVKVGLQPRIENAYVESRQPSNFANPAGNPVLHSMNTFVIYWDPTDHYHGDWQNFIDAYMQHAAAASGSLESVFAVAQQYTDRSNAPATYKQTFKGAYTDSKPYPGSGCTDPEPFLVADRIGPEVAGKHTSVCLTSEQIQEEVESFVKAHSLPTGLGDVYFLLTPPGATVCLDAGGALGHCSDYEAGNEESYAHSFCSYHADINPGGPPAGSASTILYAAIPWTAGGYGDPLLNELDRRPGWECQDGGINPAGKHGYELEKLKERNKEEQEAFEKLSPEEQQEAELEAVAEGPHAEEPNQQSCPTVYDGGCDTGLSDLVISQIGLEQVNTITDPLLNGWQDPAHNENTDECRFRYGLVHGGGVTAVLESLAGTLFDQVLSNGKYYLNDTFNLAAFQLPYPGAGCLNHANLAPEFTAPTPVNAGETVGFDGMESNIALNAATGYDSKGAPTQNYATYSWNFGDGSAAVTGFAPGAPACENPWLSPCAASVMHSYQYGGTYSVTLTVTDVGGDTAQVSHNVTVIGPPPPPPSGGGSGATPGAGTPGTGTPGSTGGTTLTPAVPAPVAAAAVLSHSLRIVRRNGLAVRYSVNEQVAGRFEVLIDRSLAKRLGVGGSPAAGLPSGWPPQLVIGKALVVTTKGGGSTVHIQLSHATGKRLARLHKVTLLLRMVVRNAGHTPTSTTVLTSFSLGR